MLDKSQGRDDGAKLVALAREATLAAEARRRCHARGPQRVTIDNQMVDRLLDREQRATTVSPGTTYVESCASSRLMPSGCTRAGRWAKSRS